MYTPLTASARNYRTLGYWFATGIWWTQRQSHGWIPDHSSEFGDYCARRRDEYDAGSVSFLPSVLDLWAEFSDEFVFTPPTEATRATYDQCELAGVDPTGRFHP